ncbi:hypothetical protein, partial [Segatella maculosa]
ANEDIAQDKKKENGTEAPKGSVVFATNDTKISAKRRFIDEDEFAGAKTRTDIKHTPGNGAEAYWTSDDYIWVKKQDGTWAKSTGTTLHDGGASAEFTLPGSKADYADGCEVRYTTAGNFLSYAPANLVYFPQNQSRTIANDFSKAGEWGDCGSGVAHNTGNPDKFNFTLSHKSSYLCFLPRCTNAALAPNIQLKGIKVTANQATSKASFFPGFHSFNGDDIDYIGTPTIRRSIEITLPDFPLSTTENQAANAIYLVVPPDKYDFKIEYTIKDPTTNIETVVTDIRTGITLDKGKIYDVTANLIPNAGNSLNPKDYKYYMWDAIHDYWYGYENEQPITNDPSPGPLPGVHYPQNSSDPQQRWCNENFQPTAQRNDLFKTLPNANEMFWYAYKGDAHWESHNVVYAENGHLKQANATGIWLKKKTKIMADEGITEQQMKTGYPKVSPTDWRTTDYRIQGTLPSDLVPKHTPVPNITDYFFLPSLGFYYKGKLNNFGIAGHYWPSNGIDYGLTYGLYFSNGTVKVNPSMRMLGLPAKAFE